MSEQQIYDENERQANKVINTFLLYFLGLMAIVYALYKHIYIEIGFSFYANLQFMGWFLVIAFIIIVGVYIAAKRNNWYGKWVKYALLISIDIILALFNIINIYGLWLSFAVPITLAGRYYSRRFTRAMGTLTILTYLLSYYAGIYYGMLNGYYDLNMINIPAGTELLVTDGISLSVLNAGLFSYKDYVINSLGYMMINLVFLFIITLFCYNVTEHGRKLNEAYIAQVEENAAMRSQLLATQMQPHFVFNTLTSAIYLCNQKPEEAAKVLTKLSKYLHTSIDNIDNTKMNFLSEEIDALNQYLPLEEMRYGDRLHIEYDLCAPDFKIPSLTLQPIVNNAITHGIGKKIGGGTVEITSEETKDNFVIKIIDDGAGFDATHALDNEDAKNSLYAVSQRLSIMCGGKLSIESQIDQGTTVTISVPK